MSFLIRRNTYEDKRCVNTLEVGVYNNACKKCITEKGTCVNTLEVGVYASKIAIDKNNVA